MKKLVLKVDTIEKSNTKIRVFMNKFQNMRVLENKNTRVSKNNDIIMTENKNIIVSENNSIKMSK